MVYGLEPYSYYTSRPQIHVIYLVGLKLTKKLWMSEDLKYIYHDVYIYLIVAKTYFMYHFVGLTFTGICIIIISS